MAYFEHVGNNFDHLSFIDCTSSCLLFSHPKIVKKESVIFTRSIKNFTIAIRFKTMEAVGKYVLISLIRPLFFSSLIFFKYYLSFQYYYKAHGKIFDQYPEHLIFRFVRYLNCVYALCVHVQSIVQIDARK